MLTQAPLTSFHYRPRHLSAYLYAGGLFVLYLRNKRMIQYEPADPDRFLNWLKRHNIRDINQRSTIIKEIHRKLKRAKV